jgi:RimJ/RimL family protein N-acetyltransferase
VSLRSNGEFVGQCGLIPQNIRGRDEIEVGYLFRRLHWGHGYATEAACACRDHAFELLPIERLVCFIGPRNGRSKQVASRIGMTLECVLAPSQNRWNKEVHVYAMQRKTV